MAIEVPRPAGAEVFCFFFSKKKRLACLYAFRKSWMPAFAGMTVGGRGLGGGFWGLGHQGFYGAAGLFYRGYGGGGGAGDFYGDGAGDGAFGQ